MIRIGLIGLGKTGKEIARYILGEKNAYLVMAISKDDSDKNGKELGEIIGIKDTGIIVEPVSKLSESIIRHRPHVIIDFSSPEASVKNIKILAKHNVNVVIGTTGLSSVGQKRMLVTAKNHKIGIVFAPNISFGVNVMMLLANITSHILSDYDFEIMEVHHKHKKDVPSGTAIKLANELSKNSLNKNVNITAVRAGGVVGKHTVLVVGEEDQIQISHESFSRRVFAEGALKAAYFIKDKVGYYEMRDVLNIEKLLKKYLDQNSNKKQYPQLKYDVREIKLQAEIVI